MARRAKHPHLHAVEGTKRSGRETEVVVKPLKGEPQIPDWLSGEAREIFEARLETYAARGQSVVGMEDALGHYCELDAELRSIWGSRRTPPAALVTQFRLFATEFWDTPASQVRAVPSEAPKGAKSPERRYAL